MSDDFPAEIHIGGPIPKWILGKLIQAVVQQGVCLGDYGQAVAEEATVRKALKEGKYLDLYDDQAGFGVFEELERFLVQHRIYFDRHSDSHDEYDAQNAYYRGGAERLCLHATQDKHILLDREEVVQILEDKTLDESGKLQALRQLAFPPEIADLEPIRFV